VLRKIAALCLVIGFAHSASAATLSVASDKLTYNVGETITLTVTGDDEGGFTPYVTVLGQLVYSGALVDNGTRTQLTLIGSEGPWQIQGSLFAGDDGVDAYSDAFFQISGIHSQTALNLPAPTHLRR
jgi:hypothetical protein